MKKRVLITVFLLSFLCAKTQNSYTIDGQTMELKTAVEGPIDLLWKVIDHQYRYFIQTENQELIELVNTKNTTQHYQEEYKLTLRKVTNNKVDVSDVEMTLPSLARFIDRYNTLANPEYIPLHSKGYAQLNLGIFGGITNSPFVGNPENIKSIVIGGELELLTGASKRHSGYLQLRHVAETKEFEYKTTEISLGYRYRFVKTSALSLYGDVKFATLNFSKATLIDEDSTDNNIPERVEDTAFDAPLIFGLGADWNISQRMAINLSYNQLFALFLKNQGNFSTDFTAGLKFKLN